jgi:hypothetical protein
MKRFLNEVSNQFYPKAKKSKNDYSSSIESISDELNLRIDKEFIKQIIEKRYNNKINNEELKDLIISLSLGSKHMK